MAPLDPDMPAPEKRLDYIDGWRVVAIMLVFLDHLSTNHAIAAVYDRSPLGVLSQYGETGVFIFFFISGYVVSLACLGEVARTGAFSAPAFYVRRFFRIVPPLALYLVACLALARGGIIELPLADAASAALNLCNTTILQDSCFWYVGHTWSLAFEEQFYWLFPLVFSWLELGKPPRPVAAAAALAFASLPFFFTIWWIGKTGVFIAYGLFFAGYWAAKHGERLRAMFGKRRTPALILAALVVFMPRGVIASFGGDDEAAKAVLIAYYRLFYIAAIPVLVLLSGAAGSLTRAILSFPALAYVGRASYSIYLWQQLANGPLFNGLGPGAQIALLGGAVAVCLLLFPLEMKVIDLGRRLSRRFQPSAPNPAAPPASSLRVAAAE